MDKDSSFSASLPVLTVLFVFVLLLLSVFVVVVVSVFLIIGVLTWVR